MSIRQRKANSREELLQALGSDLRQELDASGMGTIIPVHVDAKVMCVPLLPPRAHRTLRDKLLMRRATGKTGGLLFIPQLVVVFVPHVPDDCPGTVNLWVHDPILPNGNAVCGRASLPLNKGQQFVLFQPHYSIPLSDMVSGRERCFSIVCEQCGTATLNGGSAFSLFLLWEPEVSHRAHNYLPQLPMIKPVQRLALADLLRNRPQLKEQALLGTTSQRYAALASSIETCTSCGATCTSQAKCRCHNVA
nr:MAG: cell-to-cell movement protein [Picris umbravirus 1]